MDKRENYVTSRIKGIRYENMKVYINLFDYINRILYFKCNDDDEAANLSLYLGKHMHEYFYFHYNKDTGELSERPFLIEKSSCIIS